MRRMFLGLVVAGSLLTPYAARAQAGASGTQSPLVRSTANGLELSILEVKAVARLNRFGQPLVKFGSCPPGAAPKGMEDLDLIVPGQAVVVHFTITVLPAYTAKELAGPPRVIDAKGAKHEPHGLYFLPAVTVLTQFKESGQALHCEFPFAISAGAVSAIEFEGARLPKP